MTAYDLLLETLRLRREDTTDTALLADYNATALIAFNEANRDLCASVIHPTFGETVSVDANKRFDLTDLTHGVQSIIRITIGEDCTEDTNWGAATKLGWEQIVTGTIVVPGATASGSVYVLYEVIPDDLVNPNPTTGSGATSPAYIPAQYQRALCFKAASKLYARDNLKDSSLFWEAEYQAHKESMRPVDQQETVTSTYVM